MLWLHEVKRWRLSIVAFPVPAPRRVLGIHYKPTICPSNHDLRQIVLDVRVLGMALER